MSAVGPSARPAPGLAGRDRLFVLPAALLAAGLAASAQRRAAETLIAGGVAAVVVVLAAVDVRHRIIPNRIVLPATALVLLARGALLPGDALGFALAAGVAGMALLILNLLARGGVGMGDVKFALLIGATVGTHAVAAISLGFFAIFPVALVVLIRKGLSGRRAWLPLGPFLALGTLVVLMMPGTVG
ncbi:MAG TPA: A24 family peptidase [Solirubrobacteraceae bacterium]|nr:A24 family peptidase [Solirubrobacteraceae bacterium]